MSRSGLITLRTSGLPIGEVTTGDLAIANDGTVVEQDAFNYLVSYTGVQALHKRSQEIIDSLGLDDAMNRTLAQLRTDADVQNQSGKIIQERIFKMFKIISRLLPNFRQNITALFEVGFSKSQCLQRATEEFMGIFEEQIKLFGLIEPSVFALTKMSSIIKNQDMVQDLYNHLTFKIEN